VPGLLGDLGCGDACVQPQGRGGAGRMGAGLGVSRRSPRP
jgi:hypothetical protein